MTTPTGAEIAVSAGLEGATYRRFRARLLRAERQPGDDPVVPEVVAKSIFSSMGESGDKDLR